MEFPLHGRHFLKETDFTVEEWLYLLDLAAELKAAKKAGREVKYLVDKNIALIFEKTSTRTRCSFEVAAYDQGAHVTYLDPTGSQMGHKESVADTARVLGRFYDGIEFRGKKQEHVEALAELSGVPVWNGLTDEWHPTQMLPVRPSSALSPPRLGAWAISANRISWPASWLPKALNPWFLHAASVTPAAPSAT